MNVGTLKGPEKIMHVTEKLELLEHKSRVLLCIRRVQRGEQRRVERLCLRMTCFDYKTYVACKIQLCR
jgi:hypothetical protein